jgi:hypothetical protein
LVIVKCLQWHLLSEHATRQSLTKQPGQQTIQVALVRQNHFRLWQIHHIWRTLTRTAAPGQQAFRPASDLRPLFASR